MALSHFSSLGETPRELESCKWQSLVLRERGALRISSNLNNLINLTASKCDSHTLILSRFSCTLDPGRSESWGSTSVRLEGKKSKRHVWKQNEGHNKELPETLLRTMLVFIFMTSKNALMRQTAADRSFRLETKIAVSSKNHPKTCVCTICCTTVRNYGVR